VAPVAGQLTGSLQPAGHRQARLASYSYVPIVKGSGAVPFGLVVLWAQVSDGSGSAARPTDRTEGCCPVDRRAGYGIGGRPRAVPTTSASAFDAQPTRRPLPSWPHRAAPTCVSGITCFSRRRTPLCTVRICSVSVSVRVQIHGGFLRHLPRRKRRDSRASCGQPPGAPHAPLVKRASCECP
jgi:hypothetical protein